MKHTSVMTNEQVVTWLNKTKDSVSSYMNRGGSLNTDRGYELADRYGDLMDEAKIRNYHGVTLWRTFCDTYGFSYDHDQYDMFA